MKKTNLVRNLKHISSFFFKKISHFFVDLLFHQNVNNLCNLHINLILLATQKLWLGATDEGSEGAWYWDNSRNAPTFTAWQPGEPGGGGSENCAVLDESSGWHDYSCTSTFQFVCEK